MTGPVVQPPQPPVRLCCFTRHFGPTCPDGLTMCCICFDRFPPDQLDTDVDGDKVDICLACGVIR